MSWLQKANIKKESQAPSASDIIQSVLNNDMNLQQAEYFLRPIALADPTICDMLLSEYEAARGANHHNLRSLQALYSSVCSNAVPNNELESPPQPQNNPNIDPDLENLQEI